MGRHSKNPVVSAQERKTFGYGSIQGRLGSESFLSFDSCVLCLQRARPPVKVCQEGHIYCNECVVQSLLSQKKDIKRHQQLIEKLKVEEEAQRQLTREAAKQRVMQDFESQNEVMGHTSSTATAATTSAPRDAERGIKRKFQVEEDEVARLVEEAEERAIRQLEKEQAENRKAKLPSFWLPTLTPDAGPSKMMEDFKLTTLCKVSSPPHPLTLKSLTTVKFATANSKLGQEDAKPPKDDEPFLCWSCRSTFNNVQKIYVLRPCGHALCANCVDTTGKESGTCMACDAKVEDFKGKKGSGFLVLSRQGTGYSAGGQAHVKKFDLAFQ